MGRLCDRAASDLYALALRIIGSAGEAEDVVEQTLLEAWGAADGVESHPALLLRRCRSLALVRSGKRSIESTRRTPSTLEPHAVNDRARAGAARALEHLGEGDLRLAAMACFEGYSVAEIAARTHATPGDVLAGLGRILDLLQAGEGASAVFGPAGSEPTGFADACVLHAFDLLESEERDRLVSRLRAGDPALFARLAARERAAALLALSAPRAQPGPGLRARLVRAAAGGGRG